MDTQLPTSAPPRPKRYLVVAVLFVVIGALLVGFALQASTGDGPSTTTTEGMTSDKALARLGWDSVDATTQAQLCALWKVNPEAVHAYAKADSRVSRVADELMEVLQEDC